MADKEQELLSEIRKAEQLWYGKPPDGTIAPQEKTFAGYLVAELKSMGYVKWDRGKVALMIKKLVATDSSLIYQRGNEYNIADQLKEILIGGME